jgi:hypothetical protein
VLTRKQKQRGSRKLWRQSPERKNRGKEKEWEFWQAFETDRPHEKGCWNPRERKAEQAWAEKDLARHVSEFLHTLKHQEADVRQQFVLKFSHLASRDGPEREKQYPHRCLCAENMPLSFDLCLDCRSYPLVCNNYAPNLKD